jgi:hypothetical protein
MPHHAGTHRIELDVPIARQQVGLGGDQAGAEPPLPQGPAAVAGPVHVLDVAPPEVLHQQPASRRGARREQQMHVIGHEAIGGLRRTGGDRSYKKKRGLSPILTYLTVGEVNSIQSVVNQAGRPLEVVGSAARGARTATSDIDYVVPPSSLKYFEGLEGQLPKLDPNHGIIPGYGNPNIGPVIRFEPKGP